MDRRVGGTRIMYPDFPQCQAPNRISKGSGGGEGERKAIGGGGRVGRAEGPEDAPLEPGVGNAFCWVLTRIARVSDQRRDININLAYLHM